MIDMKKRYVTRDNRPVRVLANDLKQLGYPVIALVTDEEREVLIYYSTDGNQIIGCARPYDLLEHKPENDYVLDQKIYVRNRELDTWQCRHFAKLEEGKVYAWASGATSWSSGTTLYGAVDKLVWKYTKPLED